jgi:hypothetical protein
MFADRVTIFAYLFPFIERQALTDILTNTNRFALYPPDLNAGALTNSAWFNGLSEENKSAFGSVSIYRCPSNDNPEYKTGTDKNGPLSDYAVPIVKSNGDRNRFAWFALHDYGSDSTGDVSKFVGPFRVPILTFPTTGDAWQFGKGRYVRSAKFRDKISWWSDGASNQLCFGEKHIPAWALKKMTNQSAGWNGSYMFVYSSYYSANVGRLVSNNANLIAKGPQETKTHVTWRDSDAVFYADSNGNYAASSEFGAYLWGSSHPGVLNFLVGDGTVRAISTSILPDIVRKLSQVNDGGAVAIP